MNPIEEMEKAALCPHKALEEILAESKDMWKVDKTSKTSSLAESDESTHDPSDLYSRVDFELQENISEKMDENKYLRPSIEKLSTDEIVRKIGAIDPKTYGSKERTLFFLLQLRLSELGMAPYWRGAQRIRSPKVRKGEEALESESRYANDCQMIDLEWIRRTYNGHRVMGGWDGLYKGIFTGESFNYEQANIISSARFTKNQKIKNLRLIEDMQKELFILRTDKVAKEMQRMMDKVGDVELDLITAAHRNRRRGQKLLDNMANRLNIWLCTEITETGSPSAMCEIYQKITGEHINVSTFRKKLESLNKALIEVDSKYAFR